MTGLIGQITVESALRAGLEKGMKSKILLKEMGFYVLAKCSNEYFCAGLGREWACGLRPW